MSSYWYRSSFKFNTFYLLENYIQSVYHNAYPLTLYFQVQCINFSALSMPRMQLNVHYKGETEPTQQYKCLDIKNRKYLDDSEKKRDITRTKSPKNSM